jgi:hypothetical protein
MMAEMVDRPGDDEGQGTVREELTARADFAGVSPRLSVSATSAPAETRCWTMK